MVSWLGVPLHYDTEDREGDIQSCTEWSNSKRRVISLEIEV